MPKFVKSRFAVTNLCINHLVLVSVDELDFDSGIRITLAELLVIEFNWREFIVHLIHEIITLVDFTIVTTLTSVNFHKVCRREITFGNFSALR